MDWIPDSWIPILAGIIPSIGVGLLFWFVMRAVVRADRNERSALAQAEGAAAPSAADPSSDAPHPPFEGREK
ncbi:MAG: hypothetical protein ACK4MD_11895 [Demequina sp.]